MSQCFASYYLRGHGTSLRFLSSRLTVRAGLTGQLVYRLWRQGRRGSRLALAGLALDLGPSETSTSTESPQVRGFYPLNDGESKIQPSEFLDPFAPSSEGKPTPMMMITTSQDPRSPPLHPLVSPPVATLPLPLASPKSVGSPPLTGCRRFSRAFGSTSKSTAESQVTRVNSLNQLHSKLHGIIIRVSAYPVALVLVNILHTGQSCFYNERLCDIRRAELMGYQSLIYTWSRMVESSQEPTGDCTVYSRSYMAVEGSSLP